MKLSHMVIVAMAVLFWTLNWYHLGEMDQARLDNRAALSPCEDGE